MVRSRLAGAPYRPSGDVRLLALDATPVEGIDREAHIVPRGQE